MALIEFIINHDDGVTRMYFQDSAKVMTASGCLQADEVVVGQRVYTCDGDACTVSEINVGV